MRTLTRMLVCLLGELGVVCASGANPAAIQTASNVTSSVNDAAPKGLPDWSGIWGDLPPRRSAGKIIPPGAAQLMAELPPLRDAKALATFKEALTVYVQGGDNIANAPKTRILYEGTNIAGAYVGKLGTGGLCAMVMGGGTGNFAGRTGSGPETLTEFLFTPRRVTILTDRDMIRRIYTDGRPVPTSPFITNMGTSIGHWDGKVLVVQTVGLSPKTVIVGGVEAGAGFKIDERMYMSDDGLMHIDGVITAPQVYTEPYHYTQTYARIQNSTYVMGQYVIDCDHVDRAIDAKTNTQAADLTPPQDLPPPPAD